MSKKKSTKSGQPGTIAMRLFWLDGYRKTPLAYFDFGAHPKKNEGSERNRLIRKFTAPFWKNRVYRILLVRIDHGHPKNYAVEETLYDSKTQPGQPTDIVAYKLSVRLKDAELRRMRESNSQVRQLMTMKSVGDDVQTIIQQFWKELTGKRLANNYTSAAIYRQADNRKVGYFDWRGGLVIEDMAFKTALGDHAATFEMRHGFKQLAI